MIDVGLGRINWDDYPPFTRLGEPSILPEGLTIESILDAFEIDLAGGKPMKEDARDWVLNQVENRGNVERYFAGLPGCDRVADGVHEFLRARNRTPAKVLSPGEAIDLTKRQVRVFHECSGDLLTERPADLDDQLIRAVERYSDRLLELEIRWVDEATVTPQALGFNGKAIDTANWGSTAIEGLAFSPDELAQGGLVSLATAALFPYVQHTLAPSLTLERATRPAETWHQVADWLVPVAGYGPIVDYLLSPVFVDRFDGEPYYRLWEGGASMWIGTDAIEVRTDWARRWPNSRYLD